ncbi:GGDEF domain-containing protein [Leuconostoc mesenteroides]|uniref:GGDEF domain-containing protein n=1 Tax=Leuconostoc mesenteroides TaxID=1245 RepID=UPI001F3ED1ED|nr:GGDEF domain-containing protein [Leuconostoc mesenteroides]
MMNLAISTLISMQFLQYSPSCSRYAQWIKPIIYIAMLYTSMSVSYHFIGVVVHEYLLVLLIFYLVDKKQAFQLAVITPFVRMLYMLFVDGHLTFSNILASLLLAGLVILYIGAFDKYISNQILSMIISEICIVITSIFFSAFIPHMVVYNMFNWSMNWTICASLAIITILITRKIYFQVTNLQSENIQLQREVIFDDLTGFFNYKKFEQDILLDPVKPMNTGIAVIDLDYFKNVNDTYGHEAGNKVLQEFSLFLRERLAYKLNSKDLGIYRYGGEEFVWMFDPNNFSDIGKFLKSMQLELSKLPLGDQNHLMSFSAGVSFSKNYNFNLKVTFDVADNLVYRSKNAGRSKIVIEG